MARDKSEKTIKGKDTNGIFHPGKGKPPGINKEGGPELQATPPEKLDEYLAMTDKYTDGEDGLAEDIIIRHPNRNTSKSTENFSGKNANKRDSQKNIEEGMQAVPEQLPGVLTNDRFSELANYKAECAVSLFIPRHRGGVEVNEQFDRIGFKSILNTVEQQLRERGLKKEVIQNLLKPGFDLIKEEDFWKNQAEGLAVFIANGFFKFIKMPATPEQQIVIESTFYVTPLIPILTTNEYFYLLVISKQTAKLFRANAFGMYAVPVEVPQGIEEVKRIYGSDASTYRSGDSGRRAQATSIPGQTHGSGGGNPDGKDNLATYFEAVDDILWEKVFNKENVPLLLAGVEYEIPIYKSVCNYHNVWDQALTGSREHQTIPVLYHDAKELMKPYFEQKQIKALESFGNKSATQLTSSIVSDVIPAAYYGRIAQLFVCKNCELWGTFDEMSSELQLHDMQMETSEHLIDNAVVKTLATGGEVFLLNRDQMPMGSEIAAIMRY